MTTTPEMMPVLVNLLATGSSIILLRRGPTRRLRLLSLTVGIMSMSQLSSFLYATGYWTAIGFPAAAAHQLVVGMLSLLAVYLIYQEIADRNVTDRRLRLVEYEVPEGTSASTVRPVATAQKLSTSQAVCTSSAIVAGTELVMWSGIAKRDRVFDVYATLQNKLWAMSAMASGDQLRQSPVSNSSSTYSARAFAHLPMTSPSPLTPKESQARNVFLAASKN